jgi:hypothetical protein
MLGFVSDKENSQIFPQELAPVFPAVYEKIKKINSEETLSSVLQMKLQRN